MRRAKIDRLRGAGVDPFPVGFAPTRTLAQVRAEHDGLAADSSTGQVVRVAGRVVLSRSGGKLCFATLREGTDSIQVMVSLDGVGADALAAWKSDVDLGDHVGITGEVISSRRGELSVLASRWQLTAKCLRPLPDKHKGLNDPEARVRQRYVDLIVNQDSRSMVRARSELVHTLRSGLRDRGFIEVETPMLQTVHGGATARPFTTHINAYDLDLYLRIAPELYLKRCLVGGIDRVFELNRNFRNEGADSSHNPEFTMLEFYRAYGDYDEGATITRELIQAVARAVLGTTTVTTAEGDRLDLGGDWPQVTLYGAVSEAVGQEITVRTPLEVLHGVAKEHGVAHDLSWGPGKLAEALFEDLVEHTLVQPTFVRDFPLETSPLARTHRDDELLVEKWDLIGFGTELGTCFTELNDPIEQRRRLTEQSLRAADGDAEAMQLDEDFLAAMEYGMPPATGVGMGVDRLLMALTGKGIRDTILFPMVKPV
ncbi:MAG: lysyl-tRNA synthetase, class [Actinomycetota bacterium]|nr:lysyl-tRNA synthetase, class [Actinomycetota bacterium]